MANKPLSDELKRETLDALEKTGGRVMAAARLLKLPRQTFACRLERAREAPPETAEFDLPDLPDEELTAAELIQQRMKAFARKQAAREARRLVPIRVKLDGPIGILHMGDPHADDDGCDWPTLHRHVDLVQKTEGLFAGNIGDMQNNWVGRLARLYGQQATSQKQAWKLVEWLIRAVPWLYLIGGNHDAWSGDGDPVKWIAQYAGTGDYTWHGTRLGLNLPNGKQCRVNARHDFAGSSQWNPAHGPGKAAQLSYPDHIYVSGHRHVFGAGWHKQPGGTWTCAVRVGTYKVYDSFADSRGFPDHNLPACVTLVFPDANEEGFVELIKDVEFAADYLSFARRRYATSKTVAAPKKRVVT